MNKEELIIKQIELYKAQIRVTKFQAELEVESIEKQITYLQNELENIKTYGGDLESDSE